MVGREEKTVRGNQELAQQIAVQNHTLGHAGLASRSSLFCMTRRPPIPESYLNAIVVTGRESGPSLTSAPKLTVKNHPLVA